MSAANPSAVPWLDDVDPTSSMLSPWEWVEGSEVPCLADGSAVVRWSQRTVNCTRAAPASLMHASRRGVWLAAPFVARLSDAPRGDLSKANARHAADASAMQASVS
eukprot:scaffold139221_cov35-Tisochrysis_lutea.AAC.6